MAIEPRCNVCTHGEADKINAMLIAGVSCGKIAEQFGSLNRQSVWHHKKKHLPKELVKAKSLEDGNKADALLKQLETIHDRAWSLMEQAEKDKKYQPAVSALKECRAVIELTARLIGELKTGTEVNIYYSPAWIELRGTIFDALLPYPEARLALANELSKVEETTLEGEIIDAEVND